MESTLLDEYLHRNSSYGCMFVARIIAKAQLRKVAKNLNEFALMPSTRIGIINIVESLLKETGLDDENTSSRK